MATLNTVRAILRDARMREQTALIQAEIIKLIEDVVRLDKRVDNLGRHFGQAKELKVSKRRQAKLPDVVNIGGDVIKDTPDKVDLLSQKRHPC